MGEQKQVRERRNLHKTANTGIVKSDINGAFLVDDWPQLPIERQFRGKLGKRQCTQVNAKKRVFRCFLRNAPRLPKF